MKNLNTSHSWLLVGVVGILLSGTAYAIDPNRTMSQYLRDRWGAERGFPSGPVYAISQTADGYLWIGTEAGLVRFDGWNFRLLTSARPVSPTVGPVLGLMADNDRNLWVRLRGANILRYREGGFAPVTTNQDRWEPDVTAMCPSRDGALLVSVMERGALAYRNGKFVAVASAESLPRSPVISLAQTADGDIWMGTRDAGLFRLSRGQTSEIKGGLPDRKINCLLPDGEKGLWVGTDDGIVRWDGAKLTRPEFAVPLDHTQVLTMARDRDSNLWIGTGSLGLLRLTAKGTLSMDPLGDRSKEAVTALFEDREGNLWTGSARGIERLRDTVFVSYSAAEGLPSERNGPVYVDGQDRTWFAPVEGGLYWLRDGTVGRVTEAGLGNDVVYSIAGRDGDLWLGRRREGLTHLARKGAAFAARTYTQAQGLAQNSVYSVYQSRDGTVWAGTLSGGVSQLRDGRFTTYTTDSGLASNTVASVVEDSGGAMWFATLNGLSSLSQGHWRTYRKPDGLPSANVNCLLEDSSGVLWIGTVEGLAFRRSGSIRVPAGLPSSLRDRILGLAEDRRGWLWVATANSVLRVERDKLLAGGLVDGDVREYGLADGLHGLEGIKRHRSVVADSLGRIWFSMNRGLSVVDPSRLRNSSAPAIVHIQTISADGRPLDLESRMRIPAGRQRIALTYAGLSLSVPERVRFRYALDGFDRGWSEPTAARDAVYTNLGPGQYRFRVIASNADGLWNGAEGAIGFEIEPAVWQTLWFRLGCLLACAFSILAFYRFRLHQLTRQLNVRFEERLAERMRIAQELHDTLLQGFLSASMQLHVAVDQLPADSEAKPRLRRVLELMGRVIEEGRNAVRGLRSEHVDWSDLEDAFSRVPQELAVPESTEFRVIVEGRERPLHPVIRDEVYRIGREALVNAFRHSGAGRVEVELEYAPKHLRIVVRDNGRGIDPEMLRLGREGHWGLAGMRERAERIGAQFKVWSRAGAGTEVGLVVPGHVAFQYRKAGVVVQNVGGKRDS